MEFYEKVNRIAKTEKGEIEGIPGNIPQYTVFKGIPLCKSPSWRAPLERAAGNRKVGRRLS